MLCLLKTRLECLQLHLLPMPQAGYKQVVCLGRDWYWQHTNNYTLAPTCKAAHLRYPFFTPPLSPYNLIQEALFMVKEISNSLKNM